MIFGPLGHSAKDDGLPIIVLPPWLYDIAEENGWLTKGYRWVRLEEIAKYG